jgi:hypothetical protein
MPFGFAKSVLTGGGAAQSFGDIVDTQAAASRYVAGMNSFNFVGYDTSTNPVFILATQSSTGSVWAYTACKFTWSTDTWSFGTETSVGTNSNQASADVVSKARGHGRSLAPPSGASIFAIGQAMGGTAGSQDNIDWFRLTVNTSTLAITKGSTYGSGDIYVPSGPYENVAGGYSSANGFSLIKRGGFSGSQPQVKSATDADPPVETAADNNGIINFQFGGEGGNHRVEGMKHDADDDRFATVFGGNNGAIFFINRYSTSIFAATTNSNNVMAPNGTNRGNYNQKRFLCQINDDKMAFGYHDKNTTDVYVAGATVTWVNGGTPTGTTLTDYVTTSTNDAYELTEGFQADRVYGIRYNGTTLNVEQIDFSGNTPSGFESQATFTLSATPASSGIQSIYDRSPVDTLNDATNSRKMIAGAYTDASGNARVWATKFLL